MVVAWALVFPALGALAAYLITDRVVLPRMGLGPDLQRVVAIADHASEGLGERPVAVFLGDSLTIEGIDAGVVEGASTGWHAQNIGLNGINPTGLSVLLPAILDAKPDAVVFMFRPEDLGDPGDIPVDRAYAYAYSGITGHLDAGDDLSEVDESRQEERRGAAIGAVRAGGALPVGAVAFDQYDREAGAAVGDACGCG